jgi:two-component system cell cycle response regulator DivK
MNCKELNWSSKIILVAEDVESNFLFLEEVIRKTGAEVLWAKNGQEAIELFNTNKIDLILMDIQMPKMNGFEATKIIKKLNPNIPIISQTAYAMSEDRVKSLDAGCDDYISKPIPSQKLLDLLSVYI